MSNAAALHPGQLLTGPLFNEPMRIETVQPHGSASWTVGLVGVQTERFRKVTLTAEDLARLTVLHAQHAFDGDGRLLRLGLQAYALGIAYEFDPYFGLSISRVDPLPHQLEAVYDDLLKLARQVPAGGRRGRGKDDHVGPAHPRAVRREPVAGAQPRHHLPRSCQASRDPARAAPGALGPRDRG